MRGPNGLLIRELIVAGDIVKAGAKKRVGVDSGELRDSIVKRITRDGDSVRVFVGSEVEHAVLHHEGTEPHRIEPRKRGGVLSFQWKGERVFFAHVNHPGTKPNRFLTDSLKDLEGRY